MRFGFFLWILLLFSDATIAQQSMDEAEINNKLENIRQRLTTLKNELNQAEGEEAKLIQELESQDQKINLQGQKVRDIKSKINTAEQQVAVLGKQIKIKSDGISDQKSQMAELLRLHVFINHDRILKMMLLNPSTQNAETTQHQIKYLQFKLYDLIKSIAEQIKQLEQYQTQIAQQKQTLELEEQTLNDEQVVMLEQKRQRAVVLSSLRKPLPATKPKINL